MSCHRLVDPARGLQAVDVRRDGVGTARAGQYNLGRRTTTPALRGVEQSLRPADGIAVSFHFESCVTLKLT